MTLKELLEYWDDIDKRGAYLPGIRALCQEDRYYLLVKALNRPDMLHPWLYERCREVEAAPDGYLDLWAREHYKSTIITYAGAIQEILKNPEITIGIFSHTASISGKFLAQIKREFEDNQTLKAAFPDILYSNPRKEAASWSVDNGIIVRRNSNPKEATVEAWGLVDGQPTSKHFSLIIYDDVVTIESVNTPEQIKKTTTAWEVSDNLGAVGGRKWHVGTRYSYADTYHDIISRGAVKVRLYAATKDGTLDGEPVLFPPEVWEKKKIDQGEATISCQMLQNPLAGHQRMFNVSDLMEYEIRPETLNVYVMCDPARSKKKGSDNTAIIVIGMDYSGNKYLLDGFNHKMDLKERWQAFRQMFMKWKRVPGVQSVNMGYESFGAIADLDYFKEQMKVEGPYFEIKELAWPRDGEGSKVDRVQRLGPDVRSHKLFLPYATDSDNLTKNQRLMIDKGYEYRVAKSIKRRDENGQAYDLSEQLKQQIHFFPFGGKVDAIDALARIYDMEPNPPRVQQQGFLEPEFT